MAMLGVALLAAGLVAGMVIIWYGLVLVVTTILWLVAALNSVMTGQRQLLLAHEDRRQPGVTELPGWPPSLG
jgi:hypothetical protein